MLTVSANLDGVGGIRAADPRLVLAEENGSKDGRSTADAVALGKSLGAGSVVEGGIVRVGPYVRLDLKLLSTGGDSQPLARATITSAPDSIGALTDSVTWALLRQVWRRGEPPSPSYASLTTRSVPALRAFLEGEQFTIAGRWPEAIDAYERAIKADSTFWLAGWRYNSANGWLFEGHADSAIRSGYQSHLSAFGERDRLLVELDRDGGALREEEYVARLRSIIKRFPDDWSAWWFYADELHHTAPLIGYTNADVRAALQRTVDLNPMLVPMWQHLFDASVGHDSAQAALALKSLTALGHDDQWLRLLFAANGPLPLSLRDSVAVEVAGSTHWLDRILGSVRLLWRGYPAAQIELNRRLVALAPHDSLTYLVWEGTANAWADRGAWDSALVALEHEAAADHREAVAQGILPLTYQMAVAGAWLGGLDPARASERRAAAVKFLARLPPDSRCRQGLAGARGMGRRDAGLAPARPARARRGASPRGAEWQQGSPVHAALPRWLRAATSGSKTGRRRVARRPRSGGNWCPAQ